MSTATDVAGLVDYARGRLVERCAGLSDDEYLWEPKAGCWSVRERGGVWKVDMGADSTRWTTDPPPVTSIAWRLWHLGATPGVSWVAPPDDVTTGRHYADWWFGARGESIEAMAKAGDAVQRVDEQWSALVGVIQRFQPDDLTEVIGSIGHRYGESSVLGLLLHVADELIHHGAEVALLRDLYRARAA